MLALSPPVILRLIGHEALSLHAVLVVSLALLSLLKGSSMSTMTMP